MSLTKQDYFDIVKKGKYTNVAKIVFLRREDESIISEITGDILSGNLSINKQNGVRRSVDFTLKNVDKKYIPNKYGIWIGSKIQLYLGIKFNNEFYWEFHGIFVLLNPTLNMSINNNTISINAIDKFSLYDGQYSGNLNDYVIINNGTNINVAINSILTSSAIIGEKNLDPKSSILEPTSIALSYELRKGYGDKISSLLSELAFYSSRNIYYNRFGFLTFEEDIDDTTKGSSWDFGFDDNKLTLQSFSKNEHFDNVFNVVKVIGMTIDGLTAIATAKNINPLSNTNIDIIGEKFAPVIEDSRISDSLLAQKRADFELKKLIRLNSSINISCLPLIHLDVDEIITITNENSNLYRERFVIQSIGFSFGNNLMSITATNIKELSLEIEV